MQRDGLINDRENLVIAMIDTRGNVQSMVTIAIGLTDACQAGRLEIFRAAVASGQPSFALCHNHPSGDASPSRDDMDFTLLVKLGAGNVGLRFVDHIVLGSNESFVGIRERQGW